MEHEKILLYITFLKKFSAITGTYSDATKRTIFAHISHSINIIDTSIPVSLWTSQRNVYNGDNRSAESKAKDLFINDPFIKGIDFKNKTDIISRLEVRFGNDVLYSENGPISRIYNELLTKSNNGTRTLTLTLHQRYSLGRQLLRLMYLGER